MLEPLGNGFANVKEVAILSIEGAGGRQGMLSIGVSPCDMNGNTDEDSIPDEYIVDKPEDLIGCKDLQYKITVSGAKDLPIDLCCNPFVTY